MLGDTILDGYGKPVTRQLMDVYEQYRASVVALEQVPAEKVQRYGIIDGVVLEDGVLQARDFVEKPLPDAAPSNLAIASRYVFTPAIFDYLEKTPRGKNNEVQLTDAMRLMVREQPMYGRPIDGKRYDIGNKLDFIKTNVIFGLRHEEIGPKLREWLKDL